MASRQWRPRHHRSKRTHRSTGASRHRALIENFAWQHSVASRAWHLLVHSAAEQPEWRRRRRWRVHFSFDESPVFRCRRTYTSDRHHRSRAIVCTNDRNGGGTASDAFHCGSDERSAEFECCELCELCELREQPDRQNTNNRATTQSWPALLPVAMASASYERTEAVRSIIAVAGGSGSDADRG